MKILMIHPLYTSMGEWERSLVRNFKYLGDEIISIDYRLYISNKALNKVLIESKLYKSILLYKIKKTIENFQPNYIFVSKGELLDIEILDEIKKYNIKLINWIGDGTWEFDLIKEIAPKYDYFFTFDNETIKMLNKININNIYYLPFGFDTLLDRNFKTNNDKYYESDISFIGSPTKERMKLLKILTKMNINIKIWGHKGWLKTPYKYLYMGRPLIGKEMYYAYSKTKIVINIHYGFKQMTVPYYSGINHRIFESFGIGTYCLSNYQNDMNITFKNKLITYKDYNELYDLVPKLLKNNNPQPIQNEILTNHTLLNRLSEIKSIINI